MDESELGRLVASYNTDLDRLTQGQSQALLNSWLAGWRDVSEQLARIQDKIAAAQDAGQPVEPAWLFQRGRLADLDGALAQQVAQVGQALQFALPASVYDAAQQGDAHARNLVAQLDPYGIAGDWSGLNTDAVRNITAATASGGPLDRVLASFGDAEALQNRVRAELAAGIAAGRNPRVTAQRIRQASANLTLARAETIARTETLRAYRTAQQQAYERSDVVGGWVWLSAKTARTCAACWAMTGSWHPTSEPLAGHVNCRCRMVPRTKSWEDLGVTGLPDTNPTVEPGADAFAKLSAEEQLAILGPAKWKLWHDGDAALSDMVTATSSPVWGESVHVASLEEVRANAKARKAGLSTPGQVTYGPPGAAEPAPVPTPKPKRTPKPKPAPEPTPPADDAAAQGITTAGRTMSGRIVTPEGAPLATKVVLDAKVKKAGSITPLVDKLAQLHGGVDKVATVVEGGKTDRRGGSWTSAARLTSKPRRPSPRTFGKPGGGGQAAYDKAYQEYRDKYDAWRKEPLIPVITLNKRGGTRADWPVTFIHELGHHLDFQGGAGSRMRGAAQRMSSSGQIGPNADLSKLTDPEERLLLAMRQSKAYQQIGTVSDRAWVDYARDPVELWARAYSQWGAVSTGDTAALADLKERQQVPDGQHWDDDEFATLAPMIEDVLEKWGLMKRKAS